MKNTPIHYGFLLTAITLILFLAIYYFYIGFDYYSITVNVNAFILPAIYTLVAVILLHKKSKTEKLSFTSSFKYSFFTMFIGGTLSLLLIICFFNYVDKDAQTLLQHQRLEQSIQSVHNEYNSIKEPTQEEIQQYQELIKGLSSDYAKNDPLFSWKNSSIILVILYSFYLIISLFLSIFFRTKNSNATFHSNPSAQ